MSGNPCMRTDEPISTLWLADDRGILVSRGLHALDRAGIHSIGELVECSAEDLLNIPRIGPWQLTEIRRALGGTGMVLRGDAPDCVSDYKRIAAPRGGLAHLRASTGASLCGTPGASELARAAWLPLCDSCLRHARNASRYRSASEMPRVSAVRLGGAKASGRVALVEDTDYRLVSQYRWHVVENVKPNGSVNGPYARTNIVIDGRRQTLRMHTLITGYPLVDHRNGDGLDNRRSNLRPATHAQNGHNQRPSARSSSPYKGVSWQASNRKWRAAITIDGTSHYLGLFSSEEEAAEAYTRASLAVQGEYAFAAREASA